MKDRNSKPSKVTKDKSRSKAKRQPKAYHNDPGFDNLLDLVTDPLSITVDRSAFLAQNRPRPSGAAPDEKGKTRTDREWQELYDQAAARAGKPGQRFFEKVNSIVANLKASHNDFIESEAAGIPAGEFGHLAGYTDDEADEAEEAEEAAGAEKADKADNADDADDADDADEADSDGAKEFEDSDDGSDDMNNNNRTNYAEGNHDAYDMEDDDDYKPSDEDSEDEEDSGEDDIDDEESDEDSEDDEDDGDADHGKAPIDIEMVDAE